MRHWVLAGLTIVALAVAAAPAQAHHASGGLSIEGGDRLAITLEGGTAATSVQVRNTTRDAVVPTFIAFLRRPGGGYTELRGTTAEGGPLEAGSARRYTVTFSGAVEEGATGHLVAAGTGAPATVDVEVSRETGGVTVPGGLAAVLALVAGLALAVAAAALRARRPAPAH